MDAFQNVAREILDRIRNLRSDNEGWNTAKQTVCISSCAEWCLLENAVWGGTTLKMRRVKATPTGAREPFFQPGRGGQAQKCCHVT